MVAKKIGLVSIVAVIALCVAGVIGIITYNNQGGIVDAAQTCTGTYLLKLGKVPPPPTPENPNPEVYWYFSQVVSFKKGGILNKIQDTAQLYDFSSTPGMWDVSTEQPPEQNPINWDPSWNIVTYDISYGTFRDQHSEGQYSHPVHLEAPEVPDGITFGLTVAHMKFDNQCKTFTGNHTYYECEKVITPSELPTWQELEFEDKIPTGCEVYRGVKRLYMMEGKRMDVGIVKE